MAEKLSIFGRYHETTSSGGAGLDGLALAVGLHLSVIEVGPTRCWNVIDSQTLTKRRPVWTATMFFFAE
jgi:hypothetical protein